MRILISFIASLAFTACGSDTKVSDIQGNWVSTCSSDFSAQTPDPGSNGNSATSYGRIHFAFADGIVDLMLEQFTDSECSSVPEIQERIAGFYELGEVFTDDVGDTVRELDLHISFEGGEFTQEVLLIYAIEDNILYFGPGNILFGGSSEVLALDRNFPYYRLND